MFGRSKGSPKGNREVQLYVKPMKEYAGPFTDSEMVGLGLAYRRRVLAPSSRFSGQCTEKNINFAMAVDHRQKGGMNYKAAQL